MTGPLLVLSAWAVVGTVLTLLLAMRRRQDDADSTRTERVPGNSAPT